MFANLRIAAKCLQRIGYYRTPTAVYCSHMSTPGDNKDYLIPVAEVDIDVLDDPLEGEMFSDDEENEMNNEGKAENISVSPEATTISATNLDGIPLAPVDIDMDADEEMTKHGTVEYDNLERKVFEYPAIPNDRTGIYKFKGIKIILPKSDLHKSTYRYRLDKEDQETLADDTRICKFD